MSGTRYKIKALGCRKWQDLRANWLRGRVNPGARSGGQSLFRQDVPGRFRLCTGRGRRDRKRQPGDRSVTAEDI